MSLEDLKKKYLLDPEESELVYQTLFYSLIEDKPKDVRKANYILGQQGSGKSTFSLLHEEKDYVSIKGDYIRSFHPNFKKVMEIAPAQGLELLASDWVGWKNKLFEDLIKEGYGITLETALDDLNAVKEKIRKLIANGYAVNAYFLAVHEIESRLRLLERFCYSLLTGNVARITDINRHIHSLEQIKSFIEEVCTMGISTLYMVDSSGITYPCSCSCNQSFIILEILKNAYYKWVTKESLEKRIEAIEDCLFTYFGKIDEELFDRATTHLQNLKLCILKDSSYLKGSKLVG